MKLYSSLPFVRRSRMLLVRKEERSPNCLLLCFYPSVRIRAYFSSWRFQFVTLSLLLFVTLSYPLLVTLSCRLIVILSFLFLQQVALAIRFGRPGDLMVSALGSGSGSPGSSPGRGTVLCSWARHFTLTVPPFTQVHKQVLRRIYCVE